ncbi:MAG: hypothetical protein IJ866_02000 [Alphaproteobacteria bacterium]|nr:hypothetical protein [Alphaproteobacteria bacterium]
MNRILRVLWFGCILAVAPFFTNTAKAYVCYIGSCNADDTQLDVLPGGRANCSNWGTVKWGNRCYLSCGGAISDAGICELGVLTPYTYNDPDCGNITLHYCTLEGPSTTCNVKSYSSSTCQTAANATILGCKTYGKDKCFGSYCVRTCSVCSDGYTKTSATLSVDGCSNTYSYYTCQRSGSSGPIAGVNEGCSAYAQGFCKFGVGRNITIVDWSDVYTSTTSTKRLYRTEPDCENSVSTSTGGYCCLFDAYYRVPCPSGWTASGDTCTRAASTTGDGTTTVKVTSVYGSCSAPYATGQCNSSTQGWGWSDFGLIGQTCYKVGECQT